MLISKLSSKSQITLPKKVREAAGLHPGDAVIYEVQKNGVIEIKRIDPFDVSFHAALSKTMDEWTTPQDEAAFRDL